MHLFAFDLSFSMFIAYYSGKNAIIFIEDVSCETGEVTYRSPQDGLL